MENILNLTSLILPYALNVCALKSTPSYGFQALYDSYNHYSSVVVCLYAFCTNSFPCLPSYVQFHTCSGCKIMVFSTLHHLEAEAFCLRQAEWLVYAYSSPTSDMSHILEDENKTNHMKRC